MFSKWWRQRCESVYKSITQKTHKMINIKDVRNMSADDIHIRVDRTVSNYDVTISRVYINGVFFCHGLEDEYRADKVAGETRIPAGTYDLGIRTTGGFHYRYLDKFGETFHKGMLHVLNVPDFKWILIHVGNYDRDTDGCLLLGRADYKAMAVWQSKVTYRRFYETVISAALRGCAMIEYRDLDR